MSGAETEKYSVLKKLGRAVEWVVGLIVLALVLVTLWLFLGGESANVSIPDDSDLRVVLPEIADEDNGFIAIVASTNLIVMETNSLGDIDMTFAREYASPRTYGCERVRAEPGAAEKADRMLADNAAFFEAFSRGLERKAFRNVEPKTEIANGFGVVLPPLKVYGWATVLWRLKARREIERGEWGKALESLETIYRFGRACSDNALNAVEYIAGGFAGCAEVVDMAASDALDEAALARLAVLVCDDRARRSENVERVLKLEYFTVRTNIDATTPEMMVELYGFTARISRELANAVSSVLGGEVETRQSLQERIAEGIVKTVLLWPGYFRYTFHRRTTIARIAETTRLAIKGEVDSAADDDGYDGLLTRNGFGRNIVAAHACGCRSLLTSIDNRAFGRGRALLAIAAARWRLVHGDAMPPSLEALVPQFLDAVPVDPYSKDGSPFQYDPETGVAWSVGDREKKYDYMKVKNEKRVVEALAKGQMSGWAFRIDGRPTP